MYKIPVSTQLNHELISLSETIVANDVLVVRDAVGDRNIPGADADTVVSVVLSELADGRVPCSQPVQSSDLLLPVPASNHADRS
jgi:hypothetical protein